MAQEEEKVSNAERWWFSRSEYLLYLAITCKFLICILKATFLFSQAKKNHQKNRGGKSILNT